MHASSARARKSARRRPTLQTTPISSFPDSRPHPCRPRGTRRRLLGGGLRGVFVRRLRAAARAHRTGCTSCGSTSVISRLSTGTTTRPEVMTGRKRHAPEFHVLAPLGKAICERASPALSTKNGVWLPSVAASVLGGEPDESSSSRYTEPPSTKNMSSRSSCASARRARARERPHERRCLGVAIERVFDPRGTRGETVTRQPRESGRGARGTAAHCAAEASRGGRSQSSELHAVGAFRRHPSARCFPSSWRTEAAGRSHAAPL